MQPRILLLTESNTGQILYIAAAHIVCWTGVALPAKDGGKPRDGTAIVTVNCVAPLTVEEAPSNVHRRFRESGWVDAN